MSDLKSRRKPKRVKYHFSLVFFAAAVIFGAMFYNYYTNTTLEDVLAQQNAVVDSQASNENQNDINNENTDVPENIPEVVPEEKVNPVPESEKVGDDYLQNVVFIGDSLTYGLSTYNIVPSSNVLASVSLNLAKIDTATVDTAYGKLTIVDALTQMQPKTAYIMLGSNGMAYLNANELYQYFSTFMKNVLDVCPETEIYIISVPPVTAEKETTVNVPIKNSDIDEFNAKLLEYCNRNGLNYLDLNSSLKNENGVLADEDAENDGMHLKHSTYTKFTDYILTHVQK